MDFALIGVLGTLLGGILLDCMGSGVTNALILCWVCTLVGYPPSELEIRVYFIFDMMVRCQASLLKPDATCCAGALHVQQVLALPHRCQSLWDLLRLASSHCLESRYQSSMHRQHLSFHGHTSAAALEVTRPYHGCEWCLECDGMMAIPVQAPSNAIILWAVPPSLRPFAMSMLIVVTHVFGDVPSPTALGWLQDHLQNWRSACPLSLSPDPRLQLCLPRPRAAFIDRIL